MACRLRIDIKKLARVLLNFTKREYWLVPLLIYFFVTAALTFPFILKPTNTMVGPIGGDVGFSVIKFDAIKRELLNPFIDNKLDSIAVPDSASTRPSVDRVSFLSTLYLWTATLATNAVFAHSLESFLGLLLSAFIMFLFVRKITGSTNSAFFAGMILGFSPINIALARAAPTYTFAWLYILPIWAFWNLIVNKPSRRNIILAMLSIVPALFWTPYFSFHILLVGGVCAIIACLYLLSKIGTKRTFLIALLLGFTWLAMVAAYYVIGMTGAGGSDIPVRNDKEFYEQSAHPIMYLLPGPSSAWGSSLHATISHKFIPRAADIILYVGISSAILGAIAVYFMLFKKIKRAHAVAVSLALAVVFICFIFSLAPTITVFGHSIATPNYLVVHVVPALRAGQRLAMPMMAGIAILAAMGLYLGSEKIRNKTTKYIVVYGTIFIVALDLFTTFPVMTTVLNKYEIFDQLAKQPQGITAQYLSGSLIDGPGQVICFAQIHHKMPTVNDCKMTRDWYKPDVPNPAMRPIIMLPACSQIMALNKLNVRYVIVAPTDKTVNTCFSDSGIKSILSSDEWLIYKI